MQQHDLLPEEVEQQLYPVSGGRRFMGGFYDRAQVHGPISGYGERFQEAERMFAERMQQRALPGKWRKNRYPNKGTQNDIDYTIMEWL